ncbi:putative bucentaur or craniofacial development [Lyophyllum shimeji]|uniref:SWR1-complex protein 5 n=1 Tax=Lyophyllum shimeji TaxID=47721 RepID=A0A9P3PPU2_LYOSH|nr:putative bucentaur or craniofacial development [Lyophyllum shimeji]
MSAHQPHDSDSEDDADYIPPVEDVSSESSDDEPDSKRPRVSSPPQPPTEQDEAEKKKQRDALWSSFQASLSSTPTPPAPVKETVKIEKRYKFAGEYVVEVVEVPADSADAKKWPLWRAPKEKEKEAPSEEASQSPQLQTKDSTPAVSESSTSTTPPAKRPGPRKPKVSLAAVPASSAQKAKKISTLEKSAMDWRAHVQSSGDAGIKDELEANRRGGGYLEKVEFLNRVEERREEVIEASKGSKRRRPQ